MILLADSGSTKTEWQLIGSDAEVRTVHTIGFNPYFQDTNAIAATLREQLVPALSESHIHSVYYYGTGCNSPASYEIVASAIRMVIPEVETIEVNSDMLAAARAASGHQPGIVGILGTGSNACRYDGKQITSNSNSLGFWLGDEGSGGYLGKTLVVHFLHQKLPADLQAAFHNNYPIDRVTVLENAYQKPYPNRYFASFTPFLSEYLPHPYIQQMLSEAFNSFFDLYVKRFPEHQQWPVHFVGSIAHYFQEPLQIAAANCGITVGRILKAPMADLANYHASQP